MNQIDVMKQWLSSLEFAANEFGHKEGNDPHWTKEDYDLQESIETLRQAIEQAEEVEPLTNSYVQHVPDKCDRIIWRNQYIHLPPTAPAQQPVKVAQTFHSNGKPKGYVLLKQPQRTGE